MQSISLFLRLGKRCKVPRAANRDYSSDEGLPIPGFADCFRAHIDGTISKKGRPLKGHMHRKGYHRVTILRDGKNKHYYVHTLIAATFIGPRPTGFHVDHVDFDKMNNAPDNLRYLPAAENTRRRKPKVVVGGQ